MPEQTTGPVSERFYPDRVIGARVITYAEVDSTMNVASVRAEAGSPHGTVIRAHAQRTGRGRFARRWESAIGDSLLTSTILRMPPLAIGASVAIAATLAVRDTVLHLTGPECAIKWPNDVHVHGRKIAGVLVEASLDTAGNGFAIVGIGLNVNLNPSNFPAITEAATSLALEAGHSISMDLAEATLLAKLDTAINQIAGDPQATLAAWRAALDTLGRQVTVQTRNGPLAGIAEDVNEEGSLLLRTPDAILHTLAEGDVSLGTNFGVW